MLTVWIEDEWVSGIRASGRAAWHYTCPTQLSPWSSLFVPSGADRLVACDAGQVGVAQDGVGQIGGFDTLFEVLCAVIVLDLVTGSLKGASAKDLKSKTTFRCGIKKVTVFAVVITAPQMHRVAAEQAVELFGSNGFPPILRKAACIYHLVSEALSVVENATSLGLPVPSVIVKRVGAVKDLADRGSSK